jgi:hypothetical protein
MLSDYLAMRNEDPDFEPAYPVVAAGMRGVEGIEPDVYITDPTTGGFSYGLGPAAVGLQPKQSRESWFADTAGVGTYVRGCQRTAGPANTTGSMSSSVAMAIYAASPSRGRC